MTRNLIKFNFHIIQNIFSIAAILLVFSSCQPSENNDKITENTLPAETQAVPDTTQKRPAPEFYVIPPDMAENRVWICDNATADLFHTQHDCPVLAQCREQNGTFKNVTLIRAIEAYGRYNCQTCSKDLNHIFDKELVR